MLNRLVRDTFCKGRWIGYLEDRIQVFYTHELRSLADLFAGALQSVSTQIEYTYEVQSLTDVMGLEALVLPPPLSLEDCLGQGHVRKLASSVCLASVSFVMLSGIADALPTGYQSVEGNVQFEQAGSTLNVTTGATKAIASYQSFNINQGETVNFNLPSSRSAILNRVASGAPSQIMGRMSSNGQVFITNASGVVFGKSAQVNVGSLYASSLEMSNDDFKAGNYTAHQTGVGAAVENHGTIEAANGGYVTLVGSAIDNTGTITAPGGSVHMAVGESVSMVVDDNLAVNVTVNEALQSKVEGYNDAIHNSGSISAQDGVIKAQTALQSGLYQSAINNQGVLEAQGFDDVGGTVVLNAGTQTVKQAGTVDVSNHTGHGGTVELLGKYVTVANGSITDASGQLGGGTIHVGGDYQGHGTTPTAWRTFVDQGATLTANALETGDGGRVIVWSDDTTWFYGDISAQGGTLIGNGGFVEVSGKQSLDFRGFVDTRATNGQMGMLLLDPTNIVVDTVGIESSSLTAVDQYADPDIGGADVVFNVASINGAASNVTLQATNSITFNAPINITSAGVSLTAQAQNGITVNSTIQTNGGSVNLYADSDNNRSGALTFAAGGDITSTNNGNITLQGMSISASGHNFNAGSGDITITATSGAITASNLTGTNITLSSYGDYISPSSVLGNVVSTGTISITGTSSHHSYDTGFTFGDITSGTTLTVNTSGSLTANNVTIGSGAVSLIADSDTTRAGALTITGALSYASNQNITLKGSSVNIGAAQSLNAGSGNISITATSGAITANNLTGTNITLSSNGDYTSPSSVLGNVVSTGTISITGTSSPSNFNTGFTFGDITSGTTLTATTTGSLTANNVTIGSGAVSLIADSDTSRNGALTITGALSYPSNQNITLKGSSVNIGAAQSLNAGSGNITITATSGAITANNLTGTNITLSSNGDYTSPSSVLGNVVSTGTISITGTSSPSSFNTGFTFGDITSGTTLTVTTSGSLTANNVTIGSGAVSLIADSDTSSTGGLSITGALSYQVNENITLKGASINISGSPALNAGTGNITLTTTEGTMSFSHITGNNIIITGDYTTGMGSVTTSLGDITSTGSISIAGTGDSDNPFNFSIGNITSGTTLTATTTGDFSSNNVTIGIGAVSLIADSDTSSTGGLSITGALSYQVNENITLKGTSINISGSPALNAGTGNITLTTTEGTMSFSHITGNNIIITGDYTTGMGSVTTSLGDITSTGSISIAGTGDSDNPFNFSIGNITSGTTLTATTTGNFSANNVTIGSGAVSLIADSDTSSTGGLSITGALSYQVNENITLKGTSINISGSPALNAGTGNITLTTTEGTMSFSDITGNNIIITGDYTTGMGSVTTSLGDITSTGSISIAGTGDSDNPFNFSIGNITSGTNLTVNTTGDFSANNVTIGSGAVSLIADSDTSSTGGLSITGALSYQVNEDITLKGTSINISGSPALNAGTGNITLTTTEGTMSFSHITGNNIIITGDYTTGMGSVTTSLGDITSTGSISIAGTGDSDNPFNFSIGNITSGTNLTVNTTGDFSANNVTIGSGAVSLIGDSDSNSSGALVITGTLTTPTNQNVTLQGSSVRLASNGITAGSGSVSVTHTGTTNITVGNGATSIGGSISGGAISLTTGTTGDVVVNNTYALDTSGSNGAITINTNDITLSGAGAINAGIGAVTIAPNAGGKSITLGTGAGGTLNLSTTELGYITAGSLAVGSTSLSGGLTVNSALNTDGSGAGHFDLSLLNSGAITTTGQTITNGNNDITVNSSAGVVSLGTLSGTSGDITITNGSGAYTTNQVFTGNNISITNLANNQALTLAYDLNATGDVTLTSTGTGGITVNASQTVSSSAGSISLIGNDVTLSGNLTASAGTVTLKPNGSKSISVAGAGGTFAVDSTELTKITATSVQLGDTSVTGGLTVAGNLDLSSLGYDVDLENGGDIIAVNQTITLGVHSLDINAIGDITLTNDSSSIRASNLTANNITLSAYSHNYTSSTSAFGNIIASGAVSISGPSGGTGGGADFSFGDIVTGNSFTLSTTGGFTANDLTIGNGSVVLVADSNASGMGVLTITGTLVTPLNQDVTIQGSKVDLGSNNINAGLGDISITNTAIAASVSSGITVANLTGNDITINAKGFYSGWSAFSTIGDVTAINSINILGSAYDTITDSNFTFGNLTSGGTFNALTVGSLTINNLTVGSGSVNIMADADANYYGSLSITGSITLPINQNVLLQGSSVNIGSNNLNSGSADIEIYQTGRIGSGAGIVTGDLTGNNIIVSSICYGSTWSTSSSIGNIVASGSVDVLGTTLFGTDHNDFSIGNIQAGTTVTIDATGELVLQNLTTGTGAVHIVSDTDNSGWGSVAILGTLTTPHNQDITLQGTSVRIAGSGISAGTGTVNVTHTSSSDITVGNGATSIGGNISGGAISLTTNTTGDIVVNNTYSLNTSSANGAIVLSTDDITLSGSGAINAGTGTVTVQTNVAGKDIVVGTGAGGTLNLSTTELGYITAGSLVVGSTSLSGGLTVNSTLNTSGVGAGHFDLSLLNSGAITTTGQTITHGDNDMTVMSSAGVVTLGTLSGTTGDITIQNGSGGFVLSQNFTGNNISISNVANNQNLTLGAYNLNATGTVSLTVTGAGDITATSGLITAVDANLTSSSGDIGSSSQPILLDTTTLTLVTGGAGASYIQEASDLTLDASLGSGVLEVTTGGAIVLGAVTASGSSNISFVSGGSISNTGSLITSGTLTLDSQAAITLTNLDTGAVTVTSSNESNISLQSTGNFLIGSIETGGAGDITLNSGGWLQDGSDAGDTIMTTGNLTLVSVGAIGANSAQGLNTNIGGTLSASTTAGSITLTQGADLNVGNITAGGGGDIDLFAESGDIDLNGLVSGANVNIQAEGSILDGNAGANNVLATAGGTLRAGGVIGSVVTPLNVHVTGGLLNVWAATKSAGVSVDINGVVSASNTLTLLNSPPGQVIFNGQVLFQPVVALPVPLSSVAVTSSGGFFSQLLENQQQSTDKPQLSALGTLESRLIIPTIQNHSVLLIQGYQPPVDTIPSLQEIQQLLMNLSDASIPLGQSMMAEGDDSSTVSVVSAGQSPEAKVFQAIPALHSQN